MRVDALHGLRDLGLYGLLVLAFLGPIEAFLRFRLRQATHRGDPHAYLALADPWVTVVVALAGAGALILVTALS
jgi:hypothetical protein